VHGTGYSTQATGHPHSGANFAPTARKANPPRPYGTFLHPLRRAEDDPQLVPSMPKPGGAKVTHFYFEDAAGRSWGHVMYVEDEIRRANPEID
jgi:hypothetical protein